jgi:hypothetical protein
VALHSQLLLVQVEQVAQVLMERLLVQPAPVGHYLLLAI